MKKKKNWTKRRSRKEIAAYWFGVGVSATRHNDDEEVINKASDKIQKSIYAGYNADNSRDVSSVFKKK